MSYNYRNSEMYYNIIAALLLANFYYSGHLGINDLPQVVTATWDARALWYNVGLQLGISSAELDDIKRKRNRDTGEYLTEMLEMWLRRSDPPPTWQELAKCLRSPSVGYEALANQLPPQKQP